MIYKDIKIKIELIIKNKKERCKILIKTNLKIHK